MAHSSGCRAHTHPRRMVKPNVSFVPLTTSSALCLSRLPFPCVIGLKDCTQLYTSRTAFRQRLFRLCVHTLPFSSPRPHMSISEFSAARVTLTLLQPRLISSLLALSDVSSLATPLITKATRCLDLSTNRMIVSRHVVFNKDSFPLAASPNPTDLDFLCESASTVSTVGTRLTTAGTVAPCQPASEVPPGFEPLVAPLPAPAVHPGFLPRAAPTAAPRTAPASSAAPTTVPDGLPPHEWLALPIAYVRRPRQPAPAGTTPPPLLRPPPVGGQGVVVPITPPENPHRMVTRRRMASECYLIDSSSPPQLRLRHRPRSRPPSALPSPIPIGVRLWRMSTGP
jgi:hypothetical protein